MNAKDILTKVKTLLSIETEMAATQAKLKDGSLISYDKMDKGGVVNSIATDGTLSPLAEGDYTLEDGSTFTVDNTGTVTALTPMVETPAADAKTNCDLPTETPDENPAEEANPTDTVDDLSELENRISVLEELVAKLQDSLMLMTEATTEMDNQIAEFAKQTAVESVTLSKQTPREPLPFEKFLSQRNKI